MDAVEDKSLPYYFVGQQRTGLLVAGIIPAGITIIMCTLVVLSHCAMRIYRPEIANRVSLHLIVTACILTIIYSIINLTSEKIHGGNVACRIYAYILIATDTMSCTCLAMVGVNLVLIFIVNVNRPWRFEKYYYILIGIVGIIVIVMPLAITTSPENVVETCWYHYYFVGRFTRYFNWMWYYGWLLLSSAVAAACAFLALRKFSQEQHNFASVLNMRQSNEPQPIRRPVHPRQNIIQKNATLFRKVATRCICYPLVPILSKAAGISVEISLIYKANIPYPVFVFERFTSNTLGIMISFIYFTDPAVREAISGLFKLAVRYYVEDYYCMYFIPEKDEDGKMLSSWIKNPYSVTFYGLPEPVEDMRASESMGYMTQKDLEKAKRDSSMGFERLRQSGTTGQTLMTPSRNSSTPEFSHHHSFRKRYSYVHPLVRLVVVDGKHVCEQHSYKDTKYIANIFTDPMALGDEISHVQSRLTLLSRLRMCFPCSIFTENAYGYRKVPMYRVRPTPHQKDGNDSNENTLSYEIERWKSGSDYIGRASFQFFRYPFLASVIHWILVHIFCIVSPGNINPAIDRDFSPQSEQPLSADNPNVGETDTNGGLFENTDSFIWSRNSSNDGDIATDSVHPLDSVIISDPAKTPSHDQSNIPSTSLSGALRETTKSLARKSTRTNNANTEPESYFDIQPVEKPTNPLNIPGLHMNLQKPLVITARPYPAENIQCSTDETETPTPLDPPPISRDGRHLSLGDILPIAKDKPIPTPYTGLKPKRSSWSIVDMLNLSRHKSDFKLNPMNLGNERENDDGSRDTAKSSNQPEKRPFSARMRASFKISKSRQEPFIDDYPLVRSLSSLSLTDCHPPLPEHDQHKHSQRKEWFSALSPPPRSHFDRKQPKSAVIAPPRHPFNEDGTNKADSIQADSLLGTPRISKRSISEELPFNDVTGLEECHTRVVHVSNSQSDGDSDRPAVGYETWDADNALEQYANNLESLIHRA